MPLDDLKLPNALTERWLHSERWQWQPTLTAHDPNPPITLENPAGGGPAAELVGSANLALATVGVLTTGIPLAGSASLAIATTGVLTTGIPLAGTSSLALDATGSLTTGIPLAGSATLVVSSSVVLTTGIPLLGLADLVVSAIGVLTTGIPLAGTATLSILTSGELVGAVILTATAIQPDPIESGSLVPAHVFGRSVEVGSFEVASASLPQRPMVITPASIDSPDLSERLAEIASVSDGDIADFREAFFSPGISSAEFGDETMHGGGGTRYRVGLNTGRVYIVRSTATEAQLQAAERLGVLITE